MNAETTDPSAASALAAAVPAADSPGQTVRAARERARLSLDELAAQTKLARATLDALERDDFGALLEPVYVRGYYRKCAKVLGLPEAPLIRAYESRVAPKAPQPPAKLRLGTARDSVGGSSWSGGATVLVALAAVLLLAGVWYLRGQNGGSSGGLLPMTPPTGTQTPVEPSPEQAAGRDRDIDVAPAAGPLSMPEPSTGPTPPPPADTGSPAAATVPSPAAAVPPPAPAAPVAASASALVLNFVSTSWARVEDAGSKVLLNRVVQAGERQVLEGTPPYAVFLGNAPGVEVGFRSQSVDIRQFVKDNATARFTVPLTQ